MRRKTKFKKIYVLDTNIILNDVENIFKLSDGGKNLIVLPETVLDECDTKKSGYLEINYQARQFGRIYNDAEVLHVERASNKKMITVSSRAFFNEKVAYIDVVSKKKYVSNEGDFERSIINDRKIIEIARDMQTENSNVKFISLDIMAKNRALAEGVEVQSFNTNDDKDIVLSGELVLENPAHEYNVFDIFAKDIPETAQHIKITDKNGKPYFYYRTGNIFVQMDDKAFSKHEITPQNMGQKVLASQFIDDYYDVVVSDSPAGCTLPGTQVDVKFTEKYITSSEVKDLFGLNKTTLNQLCEKNLIRFTQSQTYNLSDFNSTVLAYTKLNHEQQLIFENDKKYKSKYLQLRYWLGTDRTLEWSLNFLEKARHEYVEIFESNDVDSIKQKQKIMCSMYT